MKAMFLSDVIAVRKYLKQQTIIAFVVGIFVAAMSGSLYAIPPFIGFMIAFSISLTVIALDEASNWQGFRLALPLSRADVVRGRYASLLALTCYSTLLGVLAALIAYGLALLFPGVSQLAELAGAGLDGFAMAFVAVLLVFLCSVLLAIMLPLCFCFGMTKAIRWVPLVAVLAFVLFFAGVGGDVTSVAWIVNVFDALLTPVGLAAMVALTVVVYGGSCLLAGKLYLKREF